jgi:hypothetical protein
MAKIAEIVEYDAKRTKTESRGQMGIIVGSYVLDTADMGLYPVRNMVHKD